MVQRFSFSLPIGNLNPNGYADLVQCEQQLFSQTSQNSNYCLKHIYYFAFLAETAPPTCCSHRGHPLAQCAHYVKGLLFSQLHVLGQVNYISYSMFHLALQHDLWESVSSHQCMPGQNDTSWREEERLYLFTQKDKDASDDKRNGRVTVINQHLGGKKQIINRKIQFYFAMTRDEIIIIPLWSSWGQNNE